MEFHLQSGFYAAVALHAVPQVPLVLCRQSSESVECRHWKYLLHCSWSLETHLQVWFLSSTANENFTIYSCPQSISKPAMFTPNIGTQPCTKVIRGKTHGCLVSRDQKHDAFLEGSAGTADNQGKPSLLLIPPVRIQAAAVSIQGWRKHLATPVASQCVDPVRLGKSLSLNLVLKNPVRQSFWQKVLILLIHSLFQLHLWKTVLLFYIAT